MRHALAPCSLLEFGSLLRCQLDRIGVVFILPSMITLAIPGQIFGWILFTGELY